jgi:hypothetical protein
MKEEKTKNEYKEKKKGNMYGKIYDFIKINKVNSPVH